MKDTRWRLRFKALDEDKETYYLEKVYKCSKYSQSVEYILTSEPNQRNKYSDISTWRFISEFTAEEIREIFRTETQDLYELERVKEEI